MKFKLFAVFVALLLLPAIASAKDVLEIRFVSQSNVVFDETSTKFQIRVICDQPFKVNTVYATVRDDTVASRHATFNGVRLQENVFGAGFEPPFIWSVAFQQDLTVNIGAESPGNELLSKMGIQALGVAGGGSFDITGVITGSDSSSTTTMSIGAVVETSDAVNNDCGIFILDTP